jgi:hypothetical protein
METTDFYSAKLMPEDIRIGHTTIEPVEKKEEIAIEIREDAEPDKKRAELAKLQFYYDNLTNDNFIRRHKKEEIIEDINNFKKDLVDFKKKYYVDDVRIELEIFDKSIDSGRIKQLELYNEPANFNEAIDLKHYDDLFNFTNMILITKNSSSDSFIFKAKFLSKPCFVKVFFMPNDNLLYEQKIYRYLKTRNGLIKPNYEEYFVKVYDIYKINSIDFKDFLNRQNIKYIDNITSWDSNYKLLDNLNSKYRTFLMVTEDIEGETYQEFYRKNNHNEKLITNTLFDMIYGIYLMNDKLKLMHNDNHFGNVLIKTNLPTVLTNYQIDSVEYIKNKNYRLCFFDFDLSFLYEENNPHLNDGWLVQNKKSPKDIWTLLNSLIVINLKMSTSPVYIENIINVIINKSKKYYNLLMKIIDDIPKGKFWNAFCENNVQSPCEIPDKESLYPEKVLKRFLNDEKIKKSIDIIDQNVYYNKYLKYKSKYLELKKTNNI